MKTASTKSESPAPVSAEGGKQRLPLRGWALEFCRRWNAGTHSLFVLHGNIYDQFAVQEGSEIHHLPLRGLLMKRFFQDRGLMLFYDVSTGLWSVEGPQQKYFQESVANYDQRYYTNYQQGYPREFVKLAPLLTNFFSEVTPEVKGVTLIINFPEKLIPAAEEANASLDERMALVTFLNWASNVDIASKDIGIILITESAAELHSDLLQNPHVAQVRIDLPDAEERSRFVQHGLTEFVDSEKPTKEWSDFSPEELAARTAGLALLHLKDLVAEAVRNGQRVTAEHVAKSKKRLIEDYCQGLVRFKDPKPGVTLDLVATQAAAKKKLRELAWLIKNNKTDVLERGVLVPGRVGVGKSFLIDCFASECGLPVMELGEFRSKWVGDTERQQMRILMTIRSLGPVIVVVDEADAVFGTREADGDSGVSGRVFAAFAAHIGDSTLRGRELWVAMTSRPDLLSIDMKRQGRFGLCVPLFPAQGPDDVVELFTVIAKVKKIKLEEKIIAYVREQLGTRPLTGSDIESILIRAKERAVLAQRDNDVQLADLEEAVNSFIDPLDPQLLRLQELAAILACSDKRYLPEKFRDLDRPTLLEEFAMLKLRLGRR